MNILLLFDKAFPIEKEKLRVFLEENSSHINFEFYDKYFSIDDQILAQPSTFNKILKKFKNSNKKYNSVFCFTTKQYNDNFFFYEYENLTIFSFYAWNYLTDLPYSNGIIYFISSYLALNIDKSEIRHTNITGCIYDFCGDKRGIDDGMRQARFCSNCYQRVSESITDEYSLSIFNDLKELMNLLSNASRWNKNILDNVVPLNTLITKRKPRNPKAIQIVIASPGDTDAERKLLLDSLERKFRIDNHEEHCGIRIMVNGWEDLSSQNGYAQDVINKKIIEQCDFVIAIFKYKLGTPLKNSATGNERTVSGTAEELLQALNHNKRNHPIGMAYFYSKAPVISLDSPDKENIEKEWERLSNFKKSIQDKMIYKPYTDTNELLSMVLRDLKINIIDYIEIKSKSSKI